jgi:hypothetical protein
MCATSQEDGMSERSTTAPRRAKPHSMLTFTGRCYIASEGQYLGSHFTSFAACWG